MQGWSGPAATNYLDGMKNAYSFWGSKLDAECEADHGGEEYLCFFGSEIYPYLAGPVADDGLNLRTLEAVSLHDTVYTPIGQVDTPGESTKWRKQMKDELSPIPRVFSVINKYHTLSERTCKMGYGPPAQAPYNNGSFRHVLAVSAEASASR